MEVLRRRPTVLRRTPAPSSAKGELGLPPRVPEELPLLEEAMTLLGAYMQVAGKLRRSRLDRLRELIGALPSVEQGKAWKTGLKELRAELADLEMRRQEPNSLGSAPGA